MADDYMFLLTTCLLLLCVLRFSDGSNRTVSSGSTSSGCLCDLTGNGCDVNCCCDPDCSDADKVSFAECTDIDANRDSRLCVSDQVIFIQNTQFKTENTGSGLFCIVKDNYEERNFYKEVRFADTKDEFSKLKGQSPYASYSRQDQASSSTPSSAYKVGDPIVLVFENGAEGFLALPKGLFTKECDDENAAGFQQDDSSECTRRILDLETQCEKEPLLAARSFYDGFQVAKNPSLSLSNGNSTHNNSSNVTSSASSSVTLTEPVLCDTDLGIPSRCRVSDPVYNKAKKTCDNVVMEVAYTVTHSNDTTGQIVSASLSLVLGTVSVSSGPLLLQRFSIRFLKVGEKVPFQRSGNPGYIVGKPLLAGKLQKDSTNKKEAIALSSDSSSWLTLVGPSTGGACLNTSERIPVVFGVDMRTGCTISIKMNGSVCELIQETALNALLGDPPTYVATFGNSDVNKIDDWVKIINNKPSNEAKAEQGTCRNMIMGLHIDVLFAQFGFLANPQPKVVGVQIKYDDRRDIHFQCRGPACQPGNSQRTQRFEVVMSVGFTDVSQRPDAQIKPRPTFEAKAPSDFFYPFL